MFAGEPLLEATAPIAEAQLAETVLLNHVTFQTAVATKAARCVLAADGAQLVDFSFRRTQGIDAGLAVARAAAIAGFTATSNVAAARRYGLAAEGTMAHSFIEAFGDEQAAFTAFGEDFPGMTTFLVDTYDTGRGVLALRDEPPPPGHQPLLAPVMRHGRPVSPPESLAAAQQRCRTDLAWLPPAERALRDPVAIPVQISDRLKILQDQVTRDLRRRAGVQHGPEGR